MLANLAFYLLFLIFNPFTNTLATTSRFLERSTLQRVLLAPGNVVLSGSSDTDMHTGIEPRADPNTVTIEVDPSTLTDPISPEDSLAVRQAEDFNLMRRTCPAETPWLCERRTCMDILKHQCCRGGQLCLVPDLCLRNPRGHIQCG